MDTFSETKAPTPWERQNTHESICACSFALLLSPCLCVLCVCLCLSYQMAPRELEPRTLQSGIEDTASTGNWAQGFQFAGLAHCHCAAEGLVECYASLLAAKFAHL